MILINTTPASRFNNRMLFNKKQKEIYLKNNVLFANQYYCHPLCSDSSTQIQKHFNNDFSFVGKSLVYLITETIAEYPYPFFSEKTWKAMFYKTPFMLVGPKNSLKQLKEFGFKTFENFWDESYDELENAADRIDLIVQNLLDLSTLSQQDIDNLYKEMLPLLEHNQSFMENFYYDQIDSVKKQLENL